MATPAFNLMNMLIDKPYLDTTIDDLACIFNALEHNELDSIDVQDAIIKLKSARDSIFCLCPTKHENNVRICPTCNKHVYIRWDGLI